mmetsp:Transcript_21608/g.69771  ORF Transcript_21608/g.69771 Transcript_21608/m.69771 type:complete len:318 (-) Transcript_21608:73-1026(-)
MAPVPRRSPVAQTGGTPPTCPRPSRRPARTSLARHPTCRTSSLPPSTTRARSAARNLEMCRRSPSFTRTRRLAVPPPATPLPARSTRPTAPWSPRRTCSSCCTRCSRTRWPRTCTGPGWSRSASCPIFSSATASGTAGDTSWCRITVADGRRAGPTGPRYSCAPPARAGRGATTRPRGSTRARTGHSSRGSAPASPSPTCTRASWGAASASEGCQARARTLPFPSMSRATGPMPRHSSCDEEILYNVDTRGGAAVHSSCQPPPGRLLQLSCVSFLIGGVWRVRGELRPSLMSSSFRSLCSRPMRGASCAYVPPSVCI